MEIKRKMGVMERENSVIVTGQVTRGRKVGRLMGYPTANIAVEEAVAAADGVYAAWVRREEEDSRRYGAMANLGVKPTFDGGGARTLEVHLFDFEGDLYGERLAVELISFIRPELKFASADELAAQIALDEPAARRALAEASPADRAREGATQLAFVRITDTCHALFGEAWKLYLSSFPPEERRQLRTQRKIMNDAPYHFELILDRGDRTDKRGKMGDDHTGGTDIDLGYGTFVGIMLWWSFGDMRYVEHFATVLRLRGRGVGARALGAFTARSDVPVVLEVELPDTAMARRRIDFYRRQGFVYNDIPYTHPPYKRGGSRVPLMLMTHPAPITDAQLKSFLDVHHPVIHRFTM
jgi:hypothetical protein